jgi:hypothetical protein
MATEREDVQHAYEMTRQAVQASDILMRRFADDLSRVISLSNVGTGPVRMSGRHILMRAIDPVLWSFFGRTRREAATSPLYQLIEQRTIVTGTSVSRRAWDELDSMMRQADPVRWNKIVSHLAAAPIDERDGLMMTYRMLFGSHVEQQRIANSKLLDPLRQWVDPNGYRLSDRVWRVGPRLRRGIDDRIIEGVRRGESVEEIARAIREYVDPEYAPIRYMKSGRIIRTALGRRQRSAAEAARTLVRTEISRVHGVSTIDRAADVPGILGVRWRLSGSHPRFDICDEHANADLYGLGLGIYPLDRVPMFPPHPRCLCTLLPAHKPREQVRAELVSKYRHLAGVE